jgi:ACR3 family arsenite efflux pump ArsB
MKIFNSIKSISITTRLIIILLLIIYIVGFFSIRYIWRIFDQVDKVSSQKIESSVTHLDTVMIKDLYQKLGNRK